MKRHTIQSEGRPFVDRLAVRTMTEHYTDYLPEDRLQITAAVDGLDDDSNKNGE